MGLPTDAQPSREIQRVRYKRALQIRPSENWYTIKKKPFYKRLTPGTRQGTPDKQMSPSTLLLRIDGGMLYDKSSDVLQFKKACAHLRADARSPPRLSPDVL